MIKVSDLADKEVVNISDGKKIGMISDLEVDLERGKVNAIIIPDTGRFLGLFGRELEYEIKWNQIKKIGEDVILVDLKNKEDYTKSYYKDEEVKYIPREINNDNL